MTMIILRNMYLENSLCYAINLLEKGNKTKARYLLGQKTHQKTKRNKENIMKNGHPGHSKAGAESKVFGKLITMV